MSKRTHRSGARSSRAQQSPLAAGGLESDATGHRQHRLERILLEEIQAIIRDEAADPALDGVRLISVQLSVDGGHARVSYAVEAQLSDQHQIERTSREAFARATGYLRAQLTALLNLKRLPKFSFTFVGVREPGAVDPREGGEPWRG